MNTFSSFLDTSSNPNMPRQAPSPSPSQAAAAAAQHQQANGMSGQANGIPMVNGLPSGGQQTDMNHLWGVVQQLSAVLEENRAMMAGIGNGVREIQGRAEDGGPVGLGHMNGENNSASKTAEIQGLHTQIQSQQNSIADLSATNGQLHSLVQDYESALTLLLDKLRPHAYAQTQTNLALHKHYQTLLEQERATSMQLRLEHADWQAGLGRVSELARKALRAQGEAELPLQRELKEVKEENRVLRRLAGWEEREDSDEEGEAKAQ